MNIEFNRNEDAMKQSLGQMRRRLEKIYEGGGKKAIDKPYASVSVHKDASLRVSTQ